MSDKKAYEQKLQAQLDEWKADMDKLKAKADGASADARIEMDQQLKNMQEKWESGKKKLSEVANASEDKWESLKGSLTDLASKLKG